VSVWTSCLWGVSVKSRTRLRVSAYLGKHSREREREIQRQRGYRDRDRDRESTRVRKDLGTTERYEPRPACTYVHSTYSKWSGAWEGNRVGKEVGGFRV
jgi:hypothetical protein